MWEYGRERLQTADAGKVCWRANRPSAVAAEASCRHARRNRCGFAPTRAAGTVIQIPWIACLPMQSVVGFICAIRNSGQFVVPRIFRPPGARGIRRRHLPPPGRRAQQAANLAMQTGDCNRRLDGHGQSIQRASRSGSRHRRTGLRANPVCIHIAEMHDGIQPRIQPANFPDMFFGRLTGEIFSALSNPSCSVADSSVTSLNWRPEVRKCAEPQETPEPERSASNAPARNGTNISASCRQS